MVAAAQLNCMPDATDTLFYLGLIAAIKLFFKPRGRARGVRNSYGIEHN